jgi:hypothetical protein
MKNYLLLGSLFVILSLIGCNQVTPTSDIVVSETSAEIFTNTPSPSVTQTNTLAPSFTATYTHTPEPTNTPTETVTPSQTPFPKISINKAFANSFSAVASYAPLVAGFTQGTVINVLGISPDSNWILIEIPPGQSAWIKQEDVQLLDPEIELPVVEVTPAPTLTPTSATPPYISVQIEKDRFDRSTLTIYFYNFQPNEKLSITIYYGDKIFKARPALGTGESGFAMWGLGPVSLKKGGTYRIVAEGFQGSRAEKSFTK